MFAASRCFAAAAAFLALLTGTASAEVSIDRLRAYLIYEDTGELGKNIAAVDDQIVANDEKGTSTQILIDVVLKGEVTGSEEFQPYVTVSARPDFAEGDGGDIFSATYPIAFIGAKGELTRSFVVDHNCGGFILKVTANNNSKDGKPFEKRFNITCGD